MHEHRPPEKTLIEGADFSRPLDALLVNAPLRDYAVRPRVNDFTLPVLGMAYIATCGQSFSISATIACATSSAVPLRPTGVAEVRVSRAWRMPTRSSGPHSRRRHGPGRRAGVR